MTSKQDRLREIKEKSYSVTSFSPVRVSEELMQDFRWLLQQLDLAWRVNAVAREALKKECMCEVYGSLEDAKCDACHAIVKIEALKQLTDEDK